MRVVTSIFLLSCLGSWAAAQSSAPSPFDLVGPQATVKIYHHPLGADMVEITMLDAKYPPDALRDQVSRLGRELRSEPRGLNIFLYEMRPHDASTRFLRASFAVDGLTEPSTGTYRIGPIARALTGAPSGHEIRGFALIFQGLKPGRETLRSFGAKPNSPVRFEGNYIGPQSGLEYRVALNTQDPNLIQIPDRASDPIDLAVRAPAKSQPTTIWPIYAGSALGAVAIGALVYSINLRRSNRRGSLAARYATKGSSRPR